MSRKPAVIVPLYNYPLTPLTWEPLYKAIVASPDLEFIIVLNPDSGPGKPGNPSPDDNYAREVPKLNALANVCTLGYVRTDYCKRSFTTVCQDVAKYAGWSTHCSSSGLFVQGIFLDETPNEYGTTQASYLHRLGAYIKHAEGIQGRRLVGHIQVLAG
ncbi:hypothetical protein LTR78_009005 [Recurvomyces mirabilis]|uniref:Cell surface protein n=1 Tax=Recurvomyces mirabilis TaxID=574656 RepID=A0AAE0TQ73_9PEZI|nr:hypothetical protein LTR78_009005 [Recurvomyces mirabilis]KAK5150467.1 hypothetical protein LTS14_010157 [Recurvomyces mirabilis]